MAASKGQEESALKKTAIYAVLLAAAVLVPQEPVELGKLLPVETIYIYKEESRIVIETDTQDRGKGDTLSEAVADLENSAAGIIFLDTAEYLILDEEVRELLPKAGEYLKNSVRVCYAERGIDAEEATLFLSAHKPEIKLGEWAASADLQTLSAKEGRYVLTEKNSAEIAK